MIITKEIQRSRVTKVREMFAMDGTRVSFSVARTSCNHAVFVKGRTLKEAHFGIIVNCYGCWERDV